MGTVAYLASLPNGGLQERLTGVAIVAAIHFALEWLILYGPWRARLDGFIKRRNPGIADKDVNDIVVGIANRSVLSLHHVLMVPVAATVVLDPTMWARPFDASTYVSRAVMIIATGHFAFDAWCCLRDSLHEGPIFAIHGVSSFLLFAGCTVSGWAWNLWAACVMLWELSTPFVHLRYVLLNTGMKSSKLYEVNGVTLTVLFFLARIVFGLWMSFRFWQLTGDALAGRLPNPVSPTFTWYARLANLLLCGFNLHWFSKMMRYVFRHFYGQKKERRVPARPGKIKSTDSE